jgi:predicted nucleic acid-binding protein
MPSSAKYLYWDTCVFLSYLKQTPGRWPTINALFEEIQQSNRTRKIVTSRITYAEAAYIEFDKTTGFSIDEEKKLDDFWSDYHVITFIESTEEIMRLTRNLKRHAVQQGWKLKLPDAIHLASAQWLAQFAPTPDDIVFHTYNTQDFIKFSSLMPFSICEPTIQQPSLLP